MHIPGVTSKPLAPPRSLRLSLRLSFIGNFFGFVDFLVRNVLLPDYLVTSNFGEPGRKCTYSKAREKLIARSEKHFIKKCSIYFLKILNVQNLKKRS
jgi:hypothetical protein